MALSSSPKMVSPTPTITFIFLVMLILGVFTPLGDAGPAEPELSVSECLKVSSSEFEDSVRETIGVLEEVTSILSHFSSVFGDFRLSNAVSDCLDLLDLSFDELNWSAAATENPNGNIFLAFSIILVQWNSVDVDIFLLIEQ